MVKLSLPHPIPITNPTSPFRNFNFMRPIKIVGSDTDLHDYQVRIHLDRSNFPLEKCKPDGSDIRFRDDSGEILPYWIERWNAAEGVIWCKIPFIPAESSKFIWMIYGNPNAKSESNGNAVFELFDVQGIVGFWHMDELQWTGATGEVRDETGVNHGTAGGGATTTSDAVYGRAGYFDGVDDYVYCGNDESLRPSDAITLEAWIKPLSSGYEIINYRINGAGPYYVYQIRKSGAAITLYDGSDDGLGYTIPYTLSENSYHHSVLVFSKAEREFKYYVDGILRGLKTTEDYPLYTHCTPNHPDCSIFGFFIGCARNGTRHFPGTIDEVRIYNRALSPTEIQILSKNYMQKMGSYFNVRKYVTPAPVVIV